MSCPLEEGAERVVSTQLLNQSPLNLHDNQLQKQEKKLLVSQE
jgi:hypothetical protein